MTCGRQYEEIKVLHNFQDQKNEASIWGDAVHQAFEKNLGEGAPLPANMVQYDEYLEQFRGRPGILLVEQKYAINKLLQPTDFFAKDCWGRGIVDVLQIDASVAHVDDHKTGKNRKKDMQQLIIFALLVFYHHPQVDTVHCTFHWTQLGAKDTETFYRHQINALWETLIPKLDRYARAFHTGTFQPNPSGLCKGYCAVKTCEYWGSGRRR
jgi:hypothetical protein